MASVPGSHTGILRDETLALRQILGYRRETIREPRFAHPRLDSLAHLPGSSIKDVLFVSVDVDTGGGYQVISPQQSFHIGLSLFDTRSLTKPMKDPANAIQSYQYITKESKPCKWAAKHFLFGDTEAIQLPDFTRKLASLTQGREYVLVAHGINEDLKFLNNLEPNFATRACYVLDTVNAAQHPLQLYYRYSLEKLLEELDIRYDRLHVAGNDAHFALRALLMLAVRDGQMAPESITAADGELFNALSAVAHAEYTLPVWIEKPPEHVKTAPQLGIYATRRLKAAKKASRRLLQELPFADELDEQDALGREADISDLRDDGGQSLTPGSRTWNTAGGRALGHEEENEYGENGWLTKTARFDGSTLAFEQDGCGQTAWTTSDSGRRRSSTHQKARQTRSDSGMRLSDTTIISTFLRALWTMAAVTSKNGIAYDGLGRKASVASQRDVVTFQYGTSKHCLGVLVGYTLAGKQQYTIQISYDVVSAEIPCQDSCHRFYGSSADDMIEEHGSGGGQTDDVFQKFVYNGNCNIVSASVNGHTKQHDLQRHRLANQLQHQYDANGRLVRDDAGRRYGFDDDHHFLID
ncbi:hypothetical protein TgHK011_009010 [Trichoderma gracile]|nr:hypothetical protein TgHK011_009010 [Trichoderma gracile]